MHKFRLSSLLIFLLSTFVVHLQAQQPLQLFLPDLTPARIRPFVPLPDGGFYLLAEDWIEAAMFPVLVRFSADGTVLWGRRFVMEGQHAEPYSVCALPDGGTLITGTADMPGVSNHQGLLILRVNPDGNLRWAKIADVGDQINGLYPTLLHDGSVVISGGRVPDVNDSVRTFTLLVKVDSAGSMIWGKTVEDADLDNGYFLSLGPMLGNRDGTLNGTAAFTTRENFESAMGMLLHLAPDAESGQGQAFPKTAGGEGIDYSYFNDIIAAPEGGRIAVGMAQLGSHDFGLVITTDGKGTRTRGNLYGSALSKTPRLKIAYSSAAHSILLGGGWYKPNLALIDSAGTLRKATDWDPFPDNSPDMAGAYILTYAAYQFFSDGRILSGIGIDSGNGSSGTLLTFFTPDFLTCGGQATSPSENPEEEPPVDIAFSRIQTLRLRPLPLSFYNATSLEIEELSVKPILLCE